MTKLFKYLRRKLIGFDFPIFITYIVLCLFGLVMIYSASMGVAVEEGNKANYYYVKQFKNITFGLCIMLIMIMMPYSKFKTNKTMYMTLVLGSFLLLVLVHTSLGIEPVGAGAKSWLNLGVMQFQPSELAKLMYIIMLSVVLSNKQKNGVLNRITISNYIKEVVLIAIGIVLIGLETDLGAVLIISGIIFFTVLGSGMRPKSFFKLFGPILLFVAIAASIILPMVASSGVSTRRFGRLSVFMNPFEDPEDLGYQIIQGYYAIGAGGIKGAGLGESIQKLGFLPEQYTDFILAIISEELGLLGVGIVLFGLGFITLRAIVIGARCKDLMGRIIAVGVGSWIGVQTVINVGGLTGLLPMTGVALPFTSYGGSSMLMLSAAIGLVINVAMYTKRMELKQINKSI